MSTNSTVDGSEKFAAAIKRRNRPPLALQVELEHFADRGLITKQSETRFQERVQYAEEVSGDV